MVFVGSSDPVAPGPGERYFTLLELAGALAVADSPASQHGAILAHTRRVVPGGAYMIALRETRRGFRPVVTEGYAFDWAAFCADNSDRLLAGTVYSRTGSGAAAAIIAVPLLHQGTIIGYLGVARDRAFDTSEREFLEGVARIGGMALQGERLAREAERRGREIEELAAAVRDLSASLELDNIVERVARHASQWTGSPVVVWLVEADRVRAAARAGASRIRVGEERTLPKGVADWGDDDGTVAPYTGPEDSDRQLILRDGGDEILREAAWFDAEPHTAAGTTIPLTLGRLFVGFIAVGPWTVPPDPDRLRLLQRLAPHAASAIENARLHAELRRLSLTDPLVQLPNRRQLDLVLEREFAAAQRGRAVSFILFDLDRFKGYNDAYGHRAGDEALVRFARILRTETRTMNLPARYGGEEFAAVLSGAGRLGGRTHAERVRRAMLREFNGKLTVSAGVADFRPGMKTLHDLVEAADRALYRAKMLGRNRVCVATDD